MVSTESVKRAGGHFFLAGSLEGGVVVHFLTTFSEDYDFFSKGGREHLSEAVVGDQCLRGVCDPSSEARHSDFSIRKSFNLKSLAFLMQDLRL